MDILQYTLTPLMVQIAVSYVAREYWPNHAQLAFFSTLLCVNLPIMAAAIGCRLSGHGSALFMETWANSALVMQALFYYGHELKVLHWGHFPHILFLGVVFMNEITMYGGNWFGHQVTTWMCFFFGAKVFAGAIEQHAQRHIHLLWKAIVLAEFAVMSTLPLAAIWYSTTIGWFIPTFLGVVPIVFPTQNSKSLPSQSQKGLLSIMPVSAVLGAVEDAKE